MSEVKGTIELTVTGMGCDGCVKTVRGALSTVPGVERAEVDLASGRAVVHGSAQAAALIAAIVDAGYDARTA